MANKQMIWSSDEYTWFDSTNCAVRDYIIKNYTIADHINKESQIDVHGIVPVGYFREPDSNLSKKITVNLYDWCKENWPEAINKEEKGKDS